MLARRETAAISALVSSAARVCSSGSAVMSLSNRATVRRSAGFFTERSRSLISFSKGTSSGTGAPLDVS
jgi:hypothetical protein